MYRSRVSIALAIGVYACFYLGCQEKNTSSDKTSDTSSILSDSLKVQGKKSNEPADTNNLEQSALIAKAYLQRAFKDDIDKDLLDSVSRSYQVETFDLNQDKQPEIFVGLRGPYFCGSGGCTFLLLDSKGELITQFTVTRNPILVMKLQTKGWSDLVLESNGKAHLLKYNGKKYPSNPSTQPSTNMDINSIDATILKENNEENSWLPF
jgi:hypothetical protein